MKFFNRKNNKNESSNAKADKSSRVRPKTFGALLIETDSADFFERCMSSKMETGISGTRPAEEILLSPANTEPTAVKNTLRDAMNVIIAKIEDGAFDSQSLPLINGMLDKIGELASKQQERQSVYNEALNLVKSARKEAYVALCAERSRREEAIKADCEKRLGAHRNIGRKAA